MDDNVYDDNELLHLIKDNNDEVAFEKLYYKYRPLIISRLRKFRIKSINYDDYFQECLLTLSNCVNKYDPSRGKTFNKYFDMCCVNRIRNLLRSDRKFFYNVIFVDYDELEKYNYVINEKDNNYRLDEDSCLPAFSKFERLVYNLFKDGKTPKEISDGLHKPIRSIYNTFSRIKHKARKIPILSITKTKTEIWDMKKLSIMETEVIKLYNIGYKPNEIASILKLKNDQVYNALKRATKKLEEKD